MRMIHPPSLLFSPCLIPGTGSLRPPGVSGRAVTPRDGGAITQKSGRCRWIRLIYLGMWWEREVALVEVEVEEGEEQDGSWRRASSSLSVPPPKQLLGAGSVSEWSLSVWRTGGRGAPLAHTQADTDAPERPHHTMESGAGLLLFFGGNRWEGWRWKWRGWHHTKYPPPFQYQEGLPCPPSLPTHTNRLRHMVAHIK